MTRIWFFRCGGGGLWSAHQLLATISPPLSVCITSSTLSWVTSPATPSTPTRSNQPSSQTLFHPRNVSEPLHDYNPSGQTCEKRTMVLTVEEYLRCASGASSFPEEAGQPLATGLYDALHIKSTIVLIIIIVVAVLIIIIAVNSIAKTRMSI